MKDEPNMQDWTRVGRTQFMRPPSGKVTCKICFYNDYTGYVDINNATHYPADLDADIHKGFTIGKGKTLYFMMIWHSSSGHVTVYNDKASYGRWISGDTEITIHWAR